MLNDHADNFFTAFPQQLWKTLKSPMVINVCLILLSLTMISSCSYFKGGKKQENGAQVPKAAEASKQGEQKAPGVSSTTPEKKASPSSKEPPKEKLIPDSAVIDMTEAEVKKRFGEPDVVSKMPDNHILWTYQPTWKLMPDNKGTMYLEFENGKVIKILRAR